MLAFGAFAEGQDKAETRNAGASEHGVQNSIPFEQLGAEAQKQYSGDGISIVPSAGGARLHAAMQDLEGEATTEGLWLTSTADEDVGKPNRFRVVATEVGRGKNWEGKSPDPKGHPVILTATGEVQATKDAACLVRPSLIEEYTVSTDGVRQDFVVLERPAGDGSTLSVSMTVTGARSAATSYGAKLTVEATGRELAYSRLKVTDARGHQLSARLIVEAPDRMRVEVQDAGAEYPVRIDPTFSDADWISMGTRPGANNSVLSMAIDASGNVYIGGKFTVVGNTPANHVARWNGSTWFPLGSGTNGDVYSLAVSGSDLYVGGIFNTAGGVTVNYVGKWNGTTWSALDNGLTGPVYALAVAANGDLYAGGQIGWMNGDPSVEVGHVVKWDGSHWIALQNSVRGGAVHAITISGNDVYVGGEFTEAGAVPANHVAKWDGSTWSALGEGTDGNVLGLAIMGGELYAGGAFIKAGGVTVNRIAKWNGTLWSALGGGADDYVFALTASENAVYASGVFTNMSGAGPYIARWDGNAWSSMYGYGSSSEFGWAGSAGSINAMAVSPDGRVYAGGGLVFGSGTYPNPNLGQWDGSQWSTLTPDTGFNDNIRVMAVLGSDLYVGGWFTRVGDVPALHIAKWNGSNWSALGAGIDGPVFGMTGSGSTLYVGGYFGNAGGVPANHVAQWNGSTWSAMGAGINDDVMCLAVSGGLVYAGGAFRSINGTAVTSAEYMAKWNGSTWGPVGAGMDGTVWALAASGGNVYAGGWFGRAGGVQANGVARWNGSAWSALGTGLAGGGSHEVRALAVSGNDLYVGGSFSSAGGVAAINVARWNGSAWSSLGSGFGSAVGPGVEALAVSGSTVYAGGTISTTGPGRENVARWDGSTWTALGSGFDSGFTSLAVVGNSLFAGGFFQVAGGKASSFIARASLDDFFPGTLGIDMPAGSVIMVNEEDGQVTIPIVRSGGKTGSVGFTVTAANGTATANSDFTAPPSLQTMADGVTSLSIPIAILNPDNTNEPNETFTVTLSAPTGGATLGAVKTVTVRIVDTQDTTSPNPPVISSPAAGALLSVDVGGTVTVTGTATDNKGVGAVKVKLDAGGFVDAILASPGAASTAFTATVTGTLGGPNIATVQSMDTRGQFSARVTRGFNVMRLLTVNFTASLGSVTTGFAGSTFREIGKSYTITATPKPPPAPPGVGGGAIFTGWTLGGQDVANGNIAFTPQRLGMVASSLEKQTITFIFREGLTLTANFIANPYDALVIGTYNGLIKSSPTLPDRAPVGAGTEDGTAPAVSTEGYFTATVQNTGAFSGKLTIDGTALNVAGAFDQQGRARFGTAKALTLTVARLNKPSLIVKFDVGGPAGSVAPAGKITGRVTATDFRQSVTAAVSTVEADRAYYTGLTTALTVPDPYLTVTGTAPSPTGRSDGMFTVVLPPVDLGSQPARIADAFTEVDYPQGNGVGTIKVTKAGGVTLTGTLADGTPVTATGTLTQDLRVALFAQLYTLKGFLSGQVQLDSAQADSDLKTAAASEVLWSRPFINTSQYYPYGWPEVIKVDLLGARYVVTTGKSVLKPANGADLQHADDDGNVALTFSDGNLSDSLNKAANLSTADVVTKVPDNDPTFILSINRTNGAATGSFSHTDDTLSSYNAIIFQKGPNAGAYGYFLTKQPVPIDYTGQSGGVSIIGQP